MGNWERQWFSGTSGNFGNWTKPLFPLLSNLINVTNTLVTMVTWNTLFVLKSWESQNQFNLITTTVAAITKPDYYKFQTDSDFWYLLWMRYSQFDKRVTEHALTEGFERGLWKRRRSIATVSANTETKIAHLELVDTSGAGGFLNLGLSKTYKPSWASSQTRWVWYLECRAIVYSGYSKNIWFLATPPHTAFLHILFSAHHSSLNSELIALSQPTSLLVNSID